MLKPALISVMSASILKTTSRPEASVPARLARKRITLSPSENQKSTDA